MNHKAILDINSIDVSALRILRYPDPRLRSRCADLTEVDQSLRPLVDKMFELMYAAKGVGLAAPQVGLALRLFISSPNYDPTDRRVYINPRIIDAQGSEESDEGCLSFPEISCRIKRSEIVTIQAIDLDGKSFQEVGEGILARVFQHETDHIEGRLLIDRMGSVAKLANRRLIKELEEAYEKAR